MEILIRPYIGSDGAAIPLIWLRSWQSTGVPSLVTLDELQQRWPKEVAKGWIVYVALADDDLVGFMAVYRTKVEQLFIEPRHQARGIGKGLLDLAKVLMPRGFTLATALETRAPRFYEREALRRGGISIHPRFGHKTIEYVWVPQKAGR